MLRNIAKTAYKGTMFKRPTASHYHSGFDEDFIRPGIHYGGIIGGTLVGTYVLVTQGTAEALPAAVLGLGAGSAVGLTVGVMIEFPFLAPAIGTVSTLALLSSLSPPSPAPTSPSPK